MTPIISAPNVQSAPPVQASVVNAVPASLPGDSRVIFNAINASISAPEIFNNAKNPAARPDVVRGSQTRDNTVVPSDVALKSAPSENFGFSTLFLAQLFGQEAVGDASVVDTFVAGNNPIYAPIQPVQSANRGPIDAGAGKQLGPIDAGAARNLGPIDAGAGRAVEAEKPAVSVLKLTPSLLSLASKFAIITPSAAEIASNNQVSQGAASSSYLQPRGINGYIATAVRNDINLSNFPPVYVSI